MLRAAACLLVVSTLFAHADEAPDRSLRPVRVQTVTAVPARDVVIYPGTVQARVQASLGFRIGGKVIERLVDIGDRVSAGQVLARLDPLDGRLTEEAAVQVVRAAEAAAINARADFQRYQGLGRSSPAWLPSEFDKRRAAVDGADARLAQAERQLALAEEQLNYTTMTADAAGVVTDVRLEVGQVVAAGQTVFSLAHTAETEIVVDVPENRLADIRAAEAISITLWSRPDQLFAGHVREIGALADAASRTFAVRVRILGLGADTPGLGMTAAVQFSRTTGQTVVRLPASAVVSADGAASVWVLDPVAHRAVAHPVQVAAWSGDGEVTINRGLTDGEQVVTAGAALLDSGVPVTAWAGAVR